MHQRVDYPFSSYVSGIFVPFEMALFQQYECIYRLGICKAALRMLCLGGSRVTTQLDTQGTRAAMTSGCCSAASSIMVRQMPATAIFPPSPSRQLDQFPWSPQPSYITAGRGRIRKRRTYPCFIPNSQSGQGTGPGSWRATTLVYNNVRVLGSSSPRGICTCLSELIVLKCCYRH